MGAGTAPVGNQILLPRCQIFMSGAGQSENCQYLNWNNIKSVKKEKSEKHTERQ
jgi:hypothetical protein